MPEPGDKAIIECPNCGDAFAGVYTEEKELVALGGPECHTCGQREFNKLSLGDNPVKS